MKARVERVKRGDEIRVDFEALKSNFALDENGREGSIEPVPEGKGLAGVQEFHGGVALQEGGNLLAVFLFFK